MHARGQAHWEASRADVVNLLRNHGKSFARIPTKGLPGRPDLPAFARQRLEGEVTRVIEGQNATVERNYAHPFE